MRRVPEPSDDRVTGPARRIGLDAAAIVDSRLLVGAGDPGDRNRHHPTLVSPDGTSQVVGWQRLTSE